MYTRSIVLVIALVLFVAPVAAFKGGGKSGMFQRGGEKAAVGTGESVGTGGGMRNMSPKMKENKAAIQAKRADFKGDFGNLRQFFGGTMSETDVQEIRELISTNREETHEAIKTFVAEYEEGDDIEEFVDELVDMKEVLFADLAQYVVDTMDDEYDAFVEEFLVTFKEAKLLRLENHLLRKTDRETRRLERANHLSDSFHKKVQKIVENADPEGLEAFLERAETMITKKLEEIQNNEKLSDAIKEKLTDLLEELMDALEMASDEVELVQEEADDLLEEVEEALEE